MIQLLRESLNSRDQTQKILWVLLLLFFSAISFSIAVTHIFLTAAVVVYLYFKFRFDRRFPDATIFVPALAFAYCTLLSAVFAIHPSESILNTKDLALFIIVAVVYDTVRDLKDIKIVYGILIFAGVISATYGLYQFFGAEGPLIERRIKGFMGHWMTFSGLLMILNVLLFSHLLFLKKHPLWFYPAFVLISFSLLLSLTRSAWLGFLAASFVLIAMRKVRWVLAMPAMVGIILLAVIPLFPDVGSRITSMFNPNETSARHRLQMFRSGLEIIQDYPLTGVGPGMIERIYPRYRPADGVYRSNPHLHNNLVQIAAENGLLTLMCWLWLIGRVLYDLIHWKKNHMAPDEKFMIHGTIGIIISLFVAGMFEYNYGDSEIKMLFLTLITIPYAWHRYIKNEPVTNAVGQQDLVYAAAARS